MPGGVFLQNQENSRAAGRGCQESLDHVPVLELELGDNDGGLMEAGSQHGRPKGRARDKGRHGARVSPEISIFLVLSSS